MGDQDKTEKRVLSINEVAEQLNLSRDVVSLMIHEGTIRARQINRKWLIPKTALDEYLSGRDNPARVMSVDEVAAALDVHRDTVSKMLQAGIIRARKAGRTWKVPFSAMEEFLAGKDN